jgi:hypothetical protein
MRTCTVLSLTSALLLSAVASSAAAQSGEGSSQPQAPQQPPQQPPQLPSAPPGGEAPPPAPSGQPPLLPPPAPSGQAPPPPSQPPPYAPSQPPPYAPSQPPPYAPSQPPPSDSAPPPLYVHPPYEPPKEPSPPPSSTKSTALEIGYLYVTAAAWGVGTGIWIDAEAGAGIDNAGVAFIAPAILGVAAPIGLYIIDRNMNAMPEGLPSAIATGMVVGAGEALSVALYQDTTSKPGFIAGPVNSKGLPAAFGASASWGFKGLARAEVLGATIGGGLGLAFGYGLKPSPKKNMLIASSVAWGTLIGSQIGGGASASFSPWRETNDAVGLGGLIGYNVALAGAVGASLVWTPSWEQLAWMWGGLAIGNVAALPVYLFYIGSEKDARRGLVFQGVASTLGVLGGAFIGKPDREGAIAREERNEEERYRHGNFARLVGGTLAPVPGGIGASAYGVW